MTRRLAIKISPAAILWPGFFLISGCASPLVFDERANGQVVDVAMGRDFEVSLEGSSEAAGSKGAFTWGDPQLQGPLVRFLGRREDPSRHRVVFEFRAQMLGEGELRFPKVWPEGRSGPGDFSFRVRVKPADEARIVTAPTH